MKKIILVLLMIGISNIFASECFDIKSFKMKNGSSRTVSIHLEKPGKKIILELNISSDIGLQYTLQTAALLKKQFCADIESNSSKIYSSDIDSIYI